jgi:PAS domain-containing protein
MCPRPAHRYATQCQARSSQRDVGSAPNLFGLDTQDRVLSRLSNARVTLNKRLIFRAFDQTTGSVEIPSAQSRSGPDQAAPAARRRETSQDTGLPCEWLFAAAVEPVLIADAASGRILRANRAAAELLQTPLAALAGMALTDTFDTLAAPAVMESMDRARAAGSSQPVTVRGVVEGVQLSLQVSLFRTVAESYLLVRLAAGDGAPFESAHDGQPASRGPETPVFDAIEDAAVGFLIADLALRVEYANAAFLDMVRLSPPAQMRGRSLVRWLQLSGGDLARLRDQMSRRQATSFLTTQLRAEGDVSLQVEVCAVAVPDGQLACWAFTVRELPRLN